MTARHCWRDESKNYSLPQNPYPRARHGLNPRTNCAGCPQHPTWNVVGYSDESGGGFYKSDASFMDVNAEQASDHIYTHYGKSWLRPVKGVAKMSENPKDHPTSPNELKPGDLLCMVGMASGGHCGIISNLKRNGFQSNERDGGVNRATYDDLIEVDMTKPDPPGDDDPRPVLDGDSGGPVFASTGKNKTRQIWAAGLVYANSGKCDEEGQLAAVGCQDYQYMYVTKIVHNLKFAAGTTMRLRVAP